MRKVTSIVILSLLITSCGNTHKLSGIENNSTDDDAYGHRSRKAPDYTADANYGYTEKNPIKVGGGVDGPINEQAFLNALTGPNGEEVTYERTGSCCSFKSRNSPFGVGLLDRYTVSYEGIKEPVTLYINMYDKAKTAAPLGFKLR